MQLSLLSGKPCDTEMEALRKETQAVLAGQPALLKDAIKAYLKDADLALIDKAWNYLEEILGETKHFSGMLQQEHAAHVAMTLAEMHLDEDTIIGGLLHGVAKAGIEPRDLQKNFGESVARIVNGCTKITTVHYNSRLEHQAENVRKLLFAVAEDIRVLLVRLADRLQDMRVLDLLEDDETRREIALETRDLYAPFASRLGIDWIKRELEDLSFQFLYPDEYRSLTNELQSTMEERQAYVEEVVDILQQKLTENGIHPLRVFGRSKHLFSIYKKIVAQNITLDRVYDKVAFRIILEEPNECYEALGIIHADWAPVPGRIKDFISIPKSNNYQSLHTTVVGPHDHFIEVQIRTEQMDRVAQEGVAAHWAYKEGQDIGEQDARLFKELKSLVNGLKDVDDPREFLDTVRGELYDPDVYALTPTGEVKELPVNSCPVDFAYAVHSEVGHRCTGAKVNGRLVPLKYHLQNGDVVEIITSTNQTPKRGWLEFVRTSRARARIRSWFRREEREKALRLGREICEKELKNTDTSLKKLVKNGAIRTLLVSLNCSSLEDLLVKVGSGIITVTHLQKHLFPKDVVHEDIAEGAALKKESSTKTPAGKNGRQNDVPVQIEGVDSMLIHISQCCNPVPGDPIIGYITFGRGVSIHKADCGNLRNVDPRRIIDVSWVQSQGQQHRVGLVISAENKKGLLAAVSSTISSSNANIAELSARTTGDTADIHVTIEVENLAHLRKLMQHLRQMKDVLSVRRK